MKLIKGRDSNKEDKIFNISSRNIPKIIFFFFGVYHSPVMDHKNLEALLGIGNSESNEK